MTFHLYVNKENTRLIPAQSLVSASVHYLSLSSDTILRFQSVQIKVEEDLFPT